MSFPHASVAQRLEAGIQLFIAGGCPIKTFGHDMPLFLKVLFSFEHQYRILRLPNTDMEVK